MERKHERHSENHKIYWSYGRFVDTRTREVYIHHTCFRSYSLTTSLKSLSNFGGNDVCGLRVAMIDEASRRLTITYRKKLGPPSQLHINSTKHKRIIERYGVFLSLQPRTVFLHRVLWGCCCDPAIASATLHFVLATHKTAKSDGSPVSFFILLHCTHDHWSIPAPSSSRDHHCTSQQGITASFQTNASAATLLGGTSFASLPAPGGSTIVRRVPTWLAVTHTG